MASIVPKIKYLLLKAGYLPASPSLYSKDKDFQTLLFMQKVIGDFTSSIYLADTQDGYVLCGYCEKAKGGNRLFEEYFQSPNPSNLMSHLVTYMKTMAVRCAKRLIKSSQIKKDTKMSVQSRLDKFMKKETAKIVTWKAEKPEHVEHIKKLLRNQDILRTKHAKLAEDHMKQHEATKEPFHAHMAEHHRKMTHRHANAHAHLCKMLP